MFKKLAKKFSNVVKMLAKTFSKLRSNVEAMSVDRWSNLILNETIFLFLLLVFVIYVYNYYFFKLAFAPRGAKKTPRG